MKQYLKKEIIKAVLKILLILAIIQTKILINGNFIFIIGASIICTIIIETFCEWMDENWEED